MKKINSGIAYEVFQNKIVPSQANKFHENIQIMAPNAIKDLYIPDRNRHSDIGCLT